MEAIETIMEKLTSPAARREFGMVKASGHIKDETMEKMIMISLVSAALPASRLKDAVI